MMTTNITTYQPNEAQLQELQNLKNSFPFRIIYGAFNPETQEWVASAVATMRIPNRLTREGWQVFTVRASKPRL
jgi:hypothetical protein